VLLRAWDTAAQAGCAPADLAPSAEALAGTGVSRKMLKALLEAGHAEPVAEGRAGRGRAGGAGRKRAGARPRLVLTERGAEFARRLLAGANGKAESRGGGRKGKPPRPRWVAEDGELWCQGECLKRFRNDAAGQRRLLDAFEEAGWPRRIENPLPRDRKRNRKRWLHDTIGDLNRGWREGDCGSSATAPGRGCAGSRSHKWARIAPARIRWTNRS
jgi:hypothetical protein